jgi:hypothetical protein
MAGDLMPSHGSTISIGHLVAIGVMAFSIAACSSNPSTPPTSSSSPTASGSNGLSSPASSTTARTSTAAPSTRPTSATASGSTAASTPDSASTGPAALVGKLAAGVESGCVVLLDDGGAVLANLIGLDPATAPMGSSVEVNGRFEPDLLTTCQQGTPFAVASVRVR